MTEKASESVMTTPTKDMEKNELLPCPTCKGAKKIREFNHDDGGSSLIKCPICKGKGSRPAPLPPAAKKCFNCDAALTAEEAQGTVCPWCQREHTRYYADETSAKFDAPPAPEASEGIAERTKRVKEFWENPSTERMRIFEAVFSALESESRYHIGCDEDGGIYCVTCNEARVDVAACITEDVFEAETTTLTERLKEAEEVIEHYADPEQWRNVDNDATERDWYQGDNVDSHGYDRARAYLAKHQPKQEGE